MAHRILVDMDNTLCDWSKGFREWMAAQGYTITEEAETYPATIGLFAEHGIRASALVWHAIRSPGFFRHLSPHPEMISLIHSLEARGHEVWICTMPLEHDDSIWCQEEKRIWVARHLGERFIDRIVFSRQKHTIPGLYLIDDSPSIIKRANEATWKPVLVEHPYNRDVVCERRVTFGTAIDDITKVLENDGVMEVENIADSITAEVKC
ncbi:putative 5'-3' deoxyribonucleotidase [Giardia muris]|uniref:Putative 5'-3' deoxyribonucleotidase n=1 Tax=Giardia muris TaxID=5742 RepID=A0A4Z1SV71_GIAMU|nr:putative 5'-3' deoxyribonucleotidase [Giardia muris]|eukprot:TNJ29694.1 putative 5'-3' deoxyribonucleotidase [Giardia muris]